MSSFFLPWSTDLSVSPAEWIHAQRWVKGHLSAPVADQDMRGLAKGYLDRWHHMDRRIGTHDIQQGNRQVWFALVAPVVYALEEGQLWAFSLSSREEERLLRVRSVPKTLWRHYLAHRNRPDLRALVGSWSLKWGTLPRLNILDSDAPWGQRHDQITKWLAQDMCHVFDHGKVIKYWGPYDYEIHVEGYDDPLLLKEWATVGPRLEIIDQEERQRYHRAIASVFRALRRQLPRPVRVALWGHRARALAKGELAHWLWQEAGRHVHHRHQALAQHPILLPMALQAGGQWPMSFASPATPHRTLLQPQLDRGDCLSTAIDEGTPWVSTMVTLLQQGKTQSWLLRGVGRWPGDQMNDEGMPITLALARHMQQSCRHHLPPLGHMGYYPFGVEHWMHAWAGLSQPRRPQTLSGMRRLGHVVNNLADVVRKGESRHSAAPWLFQHLNGFLKGLPEDWDHPLYEDLLARWVSLIDTLGWMCSYNPHLGPLLGRLTWRQWNNFVDLAHTHERRLRPPPPASEGVMVSGWTWAGARPSSVWVEGDVHIHELTHENALNEEGEIMRHCVGGSGERCASGAIREFSVRTAAGERLSTLEVEWRQGHVQEVQHLSADNQPPPLRAKEAVARFLVAPDWVKGPWPATPEYARQEAQRRTVTAERNAFQKALSNQLWAELNHRYPERSRPTTQASERQANEG